MIKQLDEEQLRTMTLEEKDRWWLANCWKGDMPQLTLRSALTGMFLGGILSLTNLYVGIKTGWTLGVGITSVILAFAMFKVFTKLHLAKTDITLLENNAMQSIATAAGYMTGPLISSLTAYMMVTGRIVPLYQTMTWMVAVSLLGVLFAFPLKKRFINDEQLPFPEGKACGYVMDGLHSDDKAEGDLKTKILAITSSASFVYAIWRSEAILGLIKLKILAIPGFVDDFIYNLGLVPTLMGTKLSDLTIRMETDVVMVAAGGLMGIRVGVSLLIGAVVNYFILAPVLIKHGIILPNDAGVIGFRQISMWSLWGGVAMMTSASLFSFFSKPKMILASFAGLLKRGKSVDVLKDIELPMKVFVIGIPLMGFTTVVLTHYYFGVHWVMGAIAIPLIFVFTLIAVTSTGLTSITPTGALGKLTQLTYAVLEPGNISTNIMTAGINGEVAGNASNLLMDIKPGYMLGAKPRHQAMGHVLGIIAGSLVAPPVFYALFKGDLGNLGTEQLPMIAAQIWVGVAKILTKGLSFLDVTARWAILIGLILGVGGEVARSASKGKFWISPVGIGLAFILPFFTSLSMFLGGLIFWIAGKSINKESKWHKYIVENSETICAGVIAGGAIAGIIVILVEQAIGGGG
ncbi:MAG: OPT family oligopeptide transporter [Candidatus Lernaella stagnicola]|nr:OPT family oligopeptide transporter [Candidatus Lernaella stagnicola]